MGDTLVNNMVKCACGLEVGKAHPVPRDKMEVMLCRVARAANIRGYILDLMSEDGRMKEGVHVTITVDIA
jgi:hypothetical protein